MFPVPSLQSVTAPRVAVDDVDIKESDAELQLFNNVQILVLEGAGETSLSLTSPCVVSSREEKLVESDLAELRPAVAEGL